MYRPVAYIYISSIIGIYIICSIPIIHFADFTHSEVDPLHIITRGQPATIIPLPARVIEILQGAYFTEV